MGIVIFLYCLQLIVVLSRIFANDYETKKGFLKSLIPFSYIEDVIIFIREFISEIYIFLVNFYNNLK